MAGVGFELKKLYSKRGVLGGMRAVGYSTAVCAGPMILGVVLLLGIMLICSAFGRSQHERELLVCMITYSLLASLFISSLFSMVVTRFLSDMLFSDHDEVILPSFFGVNVLTLGIGGILFAVFLAFCGSSFVRCFWVWCFFMELIVCWNSQSYLTAIKEFKTILLSYVVAIGVGLMLTSLLMWLGVDTVVGTLISLCVGYGLMILFNFSALNKRFPDSNVSPFLFLRWTDKFGVLGSIGLCTTIGLFAHILIMWAGPLQVVVEGLWVGAPYYDVPALIAFLNILITTVGFVVSLEINFYPKYRDYYALFNDKGTIRDILRLEDEIARVLKIELRHIAIKQLLFTATVLSLGELIISHLPLGFNNTMYGYFRTLCVGYAIYAIANCMLLLLLYFCDYKGANIGAIVFAVSTTLCTVASLWLNEKFYGFGFLVGSMIFFVYVTLRLTKYIKNLSYYVLAAQPLVNECKAGKFSKLGALLEKKTDKAVSNGESWSGK